VVVIRLGAARSGSWSRQELKRGSSAGEWRAKAAPELRTAGLAARWRMWPDQGHRTLVALVEQALEAFVFGTP